MRVVPNESQLTGPFIVDTIVDVLVSRNALSDVVPRTREANVRRAEPARQRLAKARRDRTLEAEQCGSEFENIEKS